MPETTVHKKLIIIGDEGCGKVSYIFSSVSDPPHAAPAP
jgi:GTPase SAR1 family protein